ncbi:MAG: hypothetical protein QOJ91_1601 [Sphingomonadales bacterium]|jgi:hypothetical protein|nr:hypothetical protein [Sphingomonadales bacterium]
MAVVLIHGIGDQRPMATLRSFVEAVLEPNPLAPEQPLYWSKPDALSHTYELRRYQARAGSKRPAIDFYEYYWAHRMEGSAVSHSLQWINNLLLRRPSAVPVRLRRLWWLSWLFALVVLTLIGCFWGWTPEGAVVVMLAMLLATAKLVARLALRDWIGDAARYFDDRPRNVGVRESIRRGGVDLLKNLHECREYGRIIVVGHSLGSAIAVDILYHYWTSARETHASPDRPDQRMLFQFEKRLREPSSPSIAEVRQRQKALFKEIRGLGTEWRITDLVTLGSPLCHAPFLTGLSDEKFRHRLAQRELPTCPPVLDDKNLAYWTRYKTSDGKNRSIATLHHAACFAVTRWSNLYFEHDGWFGGDPVGGPLQPLFGPGVDDCKVVTRHWKGRFNHLDYWRSDPRDDGSPAAPLTTLRRVLSLDEGFGPNPRNKETATSATRQGRRAEPEGEAAPSPDDVCRPGVASPQQASGE